MPTNNGLAGASLPWSGPYPPWITSHYPSQSTAAKHIPA